MRPTNNKSNLVRGVAGIGAAFDYSIPARRGLAANRADDNISPAISLAARARRRSRSRSRTEVHHDRGPQFDLVLSIGLNSSGIAP
jgi:hypothetical protein